jgi:aryl-alcohol dehydrogenase-like predicted oxidoreductase
MPDDDWRKRNPEFQEPKLSANLALVEVLRGVGAPYGRSPGAVAVAWALGHPALTAAIVGLRRPQQVKEMVGAADLRLSEEDVKTIEAALPRI